MSESATPSQPKVVDIVATEGGSAGDRTMERDVRRSLLDLLSLTDGLRSDIEAVWNESPDYLARLAEWGDTLAMQQQELASLVAESGRAGEPVGGIGRVGREIAREMGAVFTPGGRLGRVAKAGARLLTAQTNAIDLVRDISSGSVLKAHRAATERHLDRLAARMPRTR